MAIQVLKGMKDILPEESSKWQYVEGVIRNVCARHGFREARTPVLEHTELFLRGVGQTTDIVQKEMYTFQDKGDRSVTLKPEGTAGFARMYIENKLFSLPQPQKLYYLNNPLFRYERPQAGRLREHHQFGVEMYGAEKAVADAECIVLIFDILKELGFDSLRVRINSIGCPECRGEYNRRLKEYLSAHLDTMCETCKTRFDTNPLRILDCKEERCRKVCEAAPKVTDCLCEDCAAHFREFQEALLAVNIPFDVDPMIVRGLDYYTRTVFEIVSDQLGAQSALCGGGRYNGLIEEVGGPATPAVGFGMGMERLILTLESLGVKFPEPETTSVYIASMGDKANLYSFSLAQDLRKRGITVEFDHVGRSFKAQFKYADKLGVRFVVVIGDEEMETGVLKLKDMETGEQRDVQKSALADEIEKLLK